MPSDVVVVGGGLVGVCAAYELASAGASVTIFDAGFPGRASDAGAGILSPETFSDPDDEFFSFGVAAANHMRQARDRLSNDGCGLGPDAYDQCGSLVVALAEHEDDWFGQVARTIAGRPTEVAEVPVAQARRMFPPLAKIWRALHNPVAARVDGRSLRKAFLEAASALGVKVADDDAVDVRLAGDKVTAVVGKKEQVGCDNVVFAGGAWSARWQHHFGTVFPVSPTKGQIVHVTLPPAELGERSSESGAWPIVQPVLNFYLVPWPNGRVACGGTFEPGEGFDVRPTAGGMRDLLRECLAIAPGLAGATFGEVRVGLRPTSPDDRPILGRVPGTSNVHVCTGHGANGLLLGPYSAALVAAGVLDPASAGKIPYGPGRFSFQSF